jgi:hypothetical protein
MSGYKGMGMHRVRWAKGGEPEIQCATCLEFLPAVEEFWQPEHGLRKCRECVRAAGRPRRAALMRRKRADPVFKETENEGRRVMRKANVEAERTYQREWYRRKRSVLARHQAQEGVA